MWEGSVWLKGDDKERLVQFLNISEEEFLEKYTNGDLTLIRKQGRDCIFYEKDKGCIVYEARPNQCSCYPFYKSMEHSEEHYNRLVNKCPGAGEGRLISADEITARIRKSVTF